MYNGLGIMFAFLGLGGLIYLTLKALSEFND